MAELSANVQKITSFHSQRRLDMLKKRTRRCRCKYCGGKLKLRRIIFSEYEDGRIEIFCNNCNRIEYGVEPEIYSSAVFFVENSGFNCFPDLDKNEKTKQMNISKVCEIMSWQNQNLGIMNEDGFCVPLQINENFVGECITLSEEDLADDVIEEIYAIE